MPSSTLFLQLRLYHSFERPRNGRQILISLPADQIPPTLTPSVFLYHLSPVVNLEQHIPHIYDFNADCFIPISDISVIRASPPSAQYGLWRVDVKLVPVSRRSAQVEATGDIAERLVCGSGDSNLSASWFGIGIIRGKTSSNHGTLWRTALQFGAALTFTIGQRYSKKVEGSADIFKTYRQVPCLAYEDVAAFMNNRPVDTQVVVVEYGGEDLVTFEHPKRAVYILGSEDCGVPPALVLQAQKHVSVPTAEGRPSSLNVAAAGAVVMYDRLMKQLRAKDDKEV